MVERKGRESLNEEVKWRTLYGGAQWNESLNKEAEWRPLFGGAQGRNYLNKRSKMETSTPHASKAVRADDLTCVYM